MQDQRLKIQAEINRELGIHTEARLLASELLGKRGVFWYQLAPDIEAFQMHLVTTTYWDDEMAAVKIECWKVVLTMVHAIWREIRKVRVESETEYGSDNPSVMVGKYIWGNLQVHRVIDDLLRSQFFQHPEVAPHSTLYFFKHRATQV